MPIAPPNLPNFDRRVGEYLRLLAQEHNDLEGKLTRFYQQYQSTPLPSVSPPLPTDPNPTSPDPTSPVGAGVGGGGDGGGGGRGGDLGGEGLGGPGGSGGVGGVGGVGRDLPLASILSARSSSPLHLDSLPGRSGNPQIPFCPRVAELPSIGDPQSQEGSLCIFNNGIYQFDGQTWGFISGSSPVVGGNEKVYLQNRTTVAFSGAAATDGVLHQNTPILPADFNALGKILHVYATGSYRTQAGQTPTLLIKVFLDFIGTSPTTLLQWQTAATTASVINQWSLDAYISVNNPGGVGAGALRATGDFRIGLNAANFIETVQVANPFGGLVDLTINHSLDFTGQFSTQTGGTPFNSITQDWTLIELLN